MPCILSTAQWEGAAHSAGLDGPARRQMQQEGMAAGAGSGMSGGLEAVQGAKDGGRRLGVATPAQACSSCGVQQLAPRVLCRACAGRVHPPPGRGVWGQGGPSACKQQSCAGGEGSARYVRLYAVVPAHHSRWHVRMGGELRPAPCMVSSTAVRSCRRALSGQQDAPWRPGGRAYSHACGQAPAWRSTVMAPTLAVAVFLRTRSGYAHSCMRAVRSHG